MTKNLSITALGLILGAALLKIWAIPFTKWASANYEFFAWQFANKNVHPVAYDVVNMSAVFPAIYISLCLGCGLLLAYLVSICFQKIPAVFSKKLQSMAAGKCSNS